MEGIAETVIVRWLLHRRIGAALEAFDTHVVDAVANGVGRATSLAGDTVRRTETGKLQAYSSVFFLGVILVVGAIFVLSGDVLDR